MPFTENSWPKAIVERMYLAILASVAEQVFCLSFGEWHEDQEHQIVKSHTEHVSGAKNGAERTENRMSGSEMF